MFFSPLPFCEGSARTSRRRDDNFIFFLSIRAATTQNNNLTDVSSTWTYRLVRMREKRTRPRIPTYTCTACNSIRPVPFIRRDDITTRTFIYIRYTQRLRFTFETINGLVTLSRTIHTSYVLYAASQ